MRNTRKIYILQNKYSSRNISSKYGYLITLKRDAIYFLKKSFNRVLESVSSSSSLFKSSFVVFQKQN